MRPIDPTNESARPTPLAVHSSKIFMLWDEQTLLKELKNNNPKAIDFLFDKYYQLLCQRCVQIINDPKYAEDIVQELFINLWNKRETLNIKYSLKGYLMQSATNRSLNYLRDNKIKFQEIEDNLEDNSGCAQLNLELGDTKKALDKYIDQLPPKCKAVFILSRFEQLKYREIADLLNISVKTVENHLALALSRLRSKVHVKKAFAC